MSGRRLAAVLAAAAYVAACGLAASRLTFYWDDHFFILTLLDRSLGGALATGINGHWWPLSTLVLYVQTRVFGFWYPGYIIVNAAIVVATCWLAWHLLTPVVTRRRWLLFGALAVYATSFGVVVNVLVITVSWPLSVALALLAALLIVRERPVWLWGTVLALSFLAGSGLFVVNAVVAAVLVVVARSGGDAGGWAWRSADVARAAVLAAVGALGTLAGYLITRGDPIDYYVDIGQSANTALPSIDVSTTLQTAVSSALAWAGSPLLPGALIAPSAMPRFMIFVSTYAVAVTVALIGVGILAWLGLRRTGGQWLGDYRSRLLFVVLLAVPTATVATVLATVRQDSLYAPRFWLLWLVPAGALWVVLLDVEPRPRLVRLVSRLGLALLVISAAAGVLALPWTLRNAADVDKARLASTPAQVEQARRCAAGLAAEPVAEIAPAVTAANYCRLVTYLREESLTGRLMGYPPPAE